MKKSLNIAKFEITNAGKLKEMTIEVNPSEKIVVIVADGGQGKTTILESIRESIELNLSNTLNYETKEGKTKMEFMDKDSGEVVYTLSSNQKRVSLKDSNGFSVTNKSDIRSMFGTTLIEPTSFCSKSLKEQVIFVKDRLGLSLEEIDLKRKNAYDKRTEVNSFVRNTKVDEVIVVGDLEELTKQKEEMKLTQINYDNILTEKNKVQSSIETEQRALTYTENEILELERKISMLKNEQENTKKGLDKLKVSLSSIDTKLNETKKVETNDIIEISNEITKITYNLEQKEKNDKILKVIEEKKIESNKLTEEIEELDKQKKSQIASLGFPDDIEFNLEDGFLYKKNTINNISSTEKLVFSIEMQKVLNKEGTLKLLLIDDLESIGTSGITIIQEMLNNDYQVFASLMKRGYSSIEFWKGDSLEINEGEVSVCQK